MPNEYARSGFHCGETASGYFDETFAVTIGGTDRTRKCHFDSLSITERADNAPSELNLSVWGFTPTLWQEIKIFDGGIDVGVPIFAGHILKITQKSHRSGERPTFDLVATDYHWLLDRYTLVTKRWMNVGVSTVVGDLITNYTNGGFTLGYCSSALGNVTDLSVYHVRVTDVLKRLVDTVSGAYFTVDYRKRISLFTSPDEEGNALTLSDSATDFWDFEYEQDGSQVQTMVRGIGGGAVLTAAAGGYIPSELSITLGGQSEVALSVDEAGWYDNSQNINGVPTHIGNPYLWLDVNALTFRSRSVSSGAGTVNVEAYGGAVGTDQYIEDVKLATTLNVANEQTDSSAQNTLQTALGGVYSGQAMGLYQDERLSWASVTTKVTAQLARYKDPLKMIRFTTTSPYVRPGRTVTVTLTHPTTISATLQIQEVVITGRRNVPLTGSVKFDRRVTAGAFLRDLPDALAAAGVV
jgi:hypothetical protein